LEKMNQIVLKKSNQLNQNQLWEQLLMHQST